MLTTQRSAQGAVVRSSASKCAAVSRRGLVVRAQVQQAVQEAEAATVDAPASSTSNSDGTTEVYIGFEKGDYAPRAGRKGRVIRDDPAKYPTKVDMGPFMGVAGGWAGGEAGLWKLRESIKAQKGAAAAAAASAPPPDRLPKPPAGQDLIYLGFKKDEIELRKAGARGRVIVDTPEKYPGKVDMGPLLGVAGGFAGGERGLQQFIKEGEVKLRQPGDAGRAQFSPVALAALLVAAGAGGGLLLNGATDLGEVVVKEELLQAPVDNNTKTLLLAAVALLGAAGAVGAGRAAISSVSRRLQDSASTLLLTGAFSVGVFFAARAVLEL